MSYGFRALPFFSDGSGSILIGSPFRIVLFSRLYATATSARLAISTNPNPRQRPEARSVTASAPKAPPAREKCVRRSRLVTELARLPTYTLGMSGLPIVSSGSDRSGRQPALSGIWLDPTASNASIYRTNPQVYPPWFLVPFRLFAHGHSAGRGGFGYEYHCLLETCTITT